MMVWQIRVYYEDTDAGGVVYHTNYLKFMERARSEWLRALNFHQSLPSLQAQAELQKPRDGDVIFVVKSVTIDYLKPARFGELLEVHSEMIKLGKASLDFHQQVKRASELLVTATVKVACLDACMFKPVALPNNLVRMIKDAG